MAEGNDGGPSQRSPPLPPSSPRRCSSGSTLQTQNDEDSELQSDEPPSSPFYEELFCNGRTPTSLVPLVPEALASSWGPRSDVVRRGYLGKQERSHRKYFVLRAGSHTGPSRLEWYKNQEKFSAVEKCAGKAALFGSNKQGVVYLRCCLGVSRIHSSRKGHTVTLYAKDHTLVLVTEDQQEQEDWYVSVKRLMEEEQKDEEHGDGTEEEDDGYCTLPPAAFFKDVWPVTVKSRGTGGSKSLAGENRLCLTATSLIVVRVGAGGDPPSVTIPLLSVRRFGHLDGLFFLELGRSAPNGPGEIWMEARDKGDQALAQRIHEAVRETIGALRVLPDFGRSPSSNKSQPQALLVSKRCRLKYRDTPGSVRPLHPLSPRKQCNYLKPQSPARVPQSSLTDSYMEMNHLRDAVSPPQSLEVAEEEDEEDEEEQEDDEERLGYMVMSPLVSHSPPPASQDDYVSMMSPGSSISESDSAPLIPEHVPRFRWSASVQPSETAARESEATIGGSARLQKVTEPEQGPAASPPPPVGCDDACALMMPPTVGLKSSGMRHQLSACLLCCLQAEDG